MDTYILMVTVDGITLDVPQGDMTKTNLLGTSLYGVPFSFYYKY